MNEYDLVKINSSQKNGFISAWEAAFNRKLASEVYEWIFDNRNIIYAFIQEGEIVAGYCLYPVSCVWQGLPATALLCNNVFVCPGHQGKHLFVKISKASLNDAHENNYGAIAYGVPNVLALPGHKRVGWGDQDKIGFLEKKVFRVNKRQKNEWFFGQLSEPDRSGLAECSKKASKEREFSIVKDRDFVRWRYESKPGVKYWFGIVRKKKEVVAYCVCKFFGEKSALHIIDLDGTDKDALASLLEDVEAIPEGFKLINVWSTTIHRSLFLSNAYDDSEDGDNFIAFNVSDLKPVYFGQNINFCLGDNDVY
ncbi:GNAT family N-acetyltransferase [Vreelandella rituensis]|uniref:GNAT family N-acetyltransferase n=1 Tax=Vreelandella rituensis TaxID=2282306 RepID=A0A368U8U9_9GAMM|nr:GNAT family N-acetyltransferase [Halomonas rituensis]RCV93385.1 GNAT family N-acetyltransferase [Halomonas rituensis]